MLLGKYIDELKKLLEDNPNTYSRIAPTIIWIYRLDGKHLGNIEIDTLKQTIEYNNGKMFGDKISKDEVEKLNNSEIVSLNGGNHFGNIEIYLNLEKKEVSF